MQKSYQLWTKLAITATVLVIIGFYFVLRNIKQQGSTPLETPSSSPGLTSPTPSAGVTPAPTSSSTPTTSVSATPGTVDHSKAAQEAYASKNYLEAIRQYTLAIEKTSDTAVRAQLWNNLGNVYRDNQNSNEAINAYTKSLELDPKFGDPYLNKAALQWGLGKKDEAIATLKAGIAQGTNRNQDLQNTLDVYEALNR